MEYKIGEVSKILNISKEMIRYYEKQGILKHQGKKIIIIVHIQSWMFFY